MQQIRLIVGLGNPGTQYENTRHNVGFDFMTRLSEIYQCPLTRQSKFHCDLGNANVPPHTVKFAKPTTFMNLSGQTVLALSQFHKIQLNEILIVHDELDLDPGTVRLKSGGGHGGHNGLRDIIERFGGRKDFYRLRIGIGHPGHKSKVHGYVLSKASADDRISIESAMNAATEFLPAMVKGQFQQVMQDLHQKNFNTCS